MRSSNVDELALVSWSVEQDWDWLIAAIDPASRVAPRSGSSSATVRRAHAAAPLAQQKKPTNDKSNPINEDGSRQQLAFSHYITIMHLPIRLNIFFSYKNATAAHMNGNFRRVLQQPWVALWSRPIFGRFFKGFFFGVLFHDFAELTVIAEERPLVTDLEERLKPSAQMRLNWSPHKQHSKSLTPCAAAHLPR